MKLILIKHGETIESKKGIIVGQLPGTLSAKGKSEAKKVAEIIKKRKLNPTLIISSDLKRTKETAKIISKKLNLPVKYEKITRERNAGIAQGKKDEQINWDLYEKKPLENRKHIGGESFLEVGRRAKNFIGLLKKHKNYGDKEILIISHNVFLSMLLSVILKWPLKKSLKFDFHKNLVVIDFSKKIRVDMIPLL